jgi:hypothetical protein
MPDRGVHRHGHEESGEDCRDNGTAARESGAIGRWCDLARDALGADALAAAWQAGAGLTIDEAIALAIAPATAPNPAAER